MAGDKHTPKQICLRMGFLIYCFVMLWLLFGQRISADSQQAQMLVNWNFTPLKTIRLYLNILSKSKNTDLIVHAFINLAGNVVMFIPLGFLLPYIYKKCRKFWLCMLTVLCIMAAVEAVQYLTCLGSCDVDDLLLNLPGAVIGFVIWKSSKTIRP